MGCRDRGPDLTPWTLYYADGSTVTGRARDEWDAAPGSEVQALVLWDAPPVTRRPWSGVSDRVIWTGEDTYAIHGWPPKVGTWMDRDAYDAIWRRAFYGPVP